MHSLPARFVALGAAFCALGSMVMAILLITAAPLNNPSLYLLSVDDSNVDDNVIRYIQYYLVQNSSLSGTADPPLLMPRGDIQLFWPFGEADLRYYHDASGNVIGAVNLTNDYLHNSYPDPILTNFGDDWLSFPASQFAFGVKNDTVMQHLSQDVPQTLLSTIENSLDHWVSSDDATLDAGTPASLLLAGTVFEGLAVAGLLLCLIMSKKLDPRMVMVVAPVVGLGAILLLASAAIITTALHNIAHTAVILPSLGPEVPAATITYSFSQSFIGVTWGTVALALLATLLGGVAWVMEHRYVSKADPEELEKPKVQLKSSAILSKSPMMYVGRSG